MKRGLIALLVLTLAISSLGIVAYAAKSRMIILGGSGVVSPKTLTIAKGDTVIWLNNSSAEGTVFFSKGKDVEAVCAAPSRFAMDAEGKYYANIPQGGTASLCFVEAGKYQYMAVREKTAGGNAEGTIIVK
jgi:plastocyanin